MAEQILKTDIPREEGFLYFVKGNPLMIYKAKMSRGGKKKK
jgi:hypothetical protein